MSWKDLGIHRKNPGPELYLAALRYAHYLWLRGLSARALLAIERALFCPLDAGNPVLHAWPRPYYPIAWIVHQHPGTTFIGNPRVHFQHLADRVGGNSRELKSIRAWACWHLVRVVAPAYSADPAHAISPPALDDVYAQLDTLGDRGESALLRDTLDIAHKGEWSA